MRSMPVTTCPKKNPISCDQVAWLKQAIDAYATVLLSKHEMQLPEWRIALDIGLLSRIKNILNLEYGDANAAWNALAHTPGAYLVWQDWKDKSPNESKE